ncbi:uncharacterized protein LOC142616768 [Castanea sativa]|uniref:uncharacterized protein LOC142616768 n=1 Tax=Castanea sativa TaxID=21020 RepID=UPI003F64C59D
MDVWKPPPQSVFKLNFDAFVFIETGTSGFGAIIRKDSGEVMAAMSAKDPPVSYSEVEMLACRKAMEFATNVGFSELVREGDNVNVITAIPFSKLNLSLLGNVVDDIQYLIHGLHWVNISCTRRGGNKVVHALAQHARNINNDMYWIKDSPPPIMEAFFHDSLIL